MIVTCPKCKTCYEIDDNLISEDEKKVRCSNCGEIWAVCKEKQKVESLKSEQEETVLNEDVEKIVFYKDEEPIIDPIVFQNEIKRNRKEWQEENIDEIFSSFSIRREREIDAYTPELVKKNSGTFINAVMSFLTLFIAVAFCLYYLRFEIAANYPQTKPLYANVGIDATYFGQGLIFEDVTKLEYDDGFYPQMIITGFIVNKTVAEAEVPTISVKLLNSDSETIEEIKYNTGVQTLKAGDKIQFDVSLDKPDVLVKYVEVTFIN